MIQTAYTTGGSPQTKELLRNALTEEGNKGYGYMKFRESLDKMKVVIPDEKTRFLSAFIPATTFGFTKAKLLETANTALQVLDREHKRFNDATSDHVSETIVTGQKEVDDMSLTIKTKSEELQKLTCEIAELQKQKAEKEVALQSAKDKIAALEKDFDLSHTEIANEIRVDIQKITTYLEG
jgi:hypothetical protein